VFRGESDPWGIVTVLTPEDAGLGDCIAKFDSGSWGKGRHWGLSPNAGTQLHPSGLSLSDTVSVLSICVVK
jgi:hypothetical protein